MVTRDFHTRAVAGANTSSPRNRGRHLGMPAVNYEMMSQALVRDAKGAPNRSCTGLGCWTEEPDVDAQPRRDLFDAFYDTTTDPSSQIPLPTTVRSPAPSTTPGSRDRRRRPAGRRRQRGSTSSCRPNIWDSVPNGYISMNSRPTGVRITGPTSRAAATRTSPPLLHTETVSSIRWSGRRAAGHQFVDAADVLFDATIPTMRHSSRHSAGSKPSPGSLEIRP
jgi:hypothetical protein